jgi:RNA polymerase sigma factor (sigma-70 family)
MVDSDDKAMIIACCRGDKASQEAFVRRYSNLIYSTIIRAYTSRRGECNSQEADDLHNTVFMRLLERRCQRLRQFKGKNGCSLASWIRVITVRTVIDHLRRSRDVLSHQSKIDGDEQLSRLRAVIPEPWERLDRMKKNEIVHRAMELLPARDRLFLRLHCLEDVPIRDVAKILHISINNAYSLKNRAVKRLKAIVDASWNGT